MSKKKELTQADVYPRTIARTRLMIQTYLKRAHQENESLFEMTGERMDLYRILDTEINLDVKKEEKEDE